MSSLYYYQVQLLIMKPFLCITLESYLFYYCLKTPVIVNSYCVHGTMPEVVAPRQT